MGRSGLGVLGRHLDRIKREGEEKEEGFRII